MKRRCLFLLMLVFLLLVPIVRVDAKTLQDMYDQLADLQVKYNNSKNNVKLTQDQINKLNKEISSIESSIEQIRGEIKTAEADIAKSKETIESLTHLEIPSGVDIQIKL